MDIPYAAAPHPPPPLVDQKQWHFHLRQSKNSKHALNVLQSSLLSTFLRASQIQVFLHRCGLRPSRPFFKSLPIMKGCRKHAACTGLPLCITRSRSIPPESSSRLLVVRSEWCWNVLRSLFLQKHMRNTCAKTFMDGAGGSVMAGQCKGGFRGSETPVTYYH